MSPTATAPNPATSDATATASTEAGETTAPVHGEELRVPERVILAPTLGVFRPLPPETVTSEGEVVSEGQVVGVIDARGDEVQVRSPFTGFLMGMLAHPGERVREGQPVAWLRAV